MPANETTTLTREKFIELLNEDLSRECQAIIAYVNYSQVLKGFRSISKMRRRRSGSTAAA